MTVHDTRSLTQTIRLFVSRKPNWNARNAKGETVLHRAVCNIAAKALVAALLDEIDSFELEAMNKLVNVILVWFFPVTRRGDAR
jgi:hypothetical protein